MIAHNNQALTPPNPGLARSVLLHHGLPGTAALSRILTLDDTGTLQATFPTPRRKTIEMSTGAEGRDGLWNQLQNLLSMDRYQQRADAVVALRRFTRHAAWYGERLQSPAVMNLEANAEEVYQRCQAELRGLQLKEVRPCLEGLVQKRADWWAAESYAIRLKPGVRELEQNSAGLRRDCRQLVRAVHPLKSGLTKDHHAFDLCLRLLDSVDSHISPVGVDRLDAELVDALRSCAFQIARVGSLELHAQPDSQNQALPSVSVVLFSPAERVEAVAWGIATECALAQAGFSNQRSQLNELNALLVQRLTRLCMPYQNLLGYAQAGRCHLMQLAAAEFVGSFKAMVTQLRLLQAALNSPEYRRATPIVFKESARELARSVGRLLTCMNDIQRPFQAVVRVAQHMEERPYSAMAALHVAMKWPQETAETAQ